MKSFLVAVCALLMACACLAGEQMSKMQPSPAFDKLKTLQGEWTGTMKDGGKEYPTSTSFRLVSDGSALLNILASGTPMEMVSMFHMDGADVMMTHYCAAHNQPRMKLVPGSDPNALEFVFTDGTNIGPNDTHMQRVKFIFVDADHHVEEWTSLANGKEETGRFEFARKK